MHRRHPHTFERVVLRRLHWGNDAVELIHELELRVVDIVAPKGVGQVERQAAAIAQARAFIVDVKYQGLAACA